MNVTIMLPASVDSDGDRVLGEIEVTLETTTSGHLRLSMVGLLWEPGHKPDAWGGQCHREIAALWADMPLVVRMTEVWARWHLNDMRAGTPKQEAAITEHYGRPRVGYEFGQACQHLRRLGLYEDDGYKYGSAWLYEPLPQEIVDEVCAWPLKVTR